MQLSRPTTRAISTALRCAALCCTLLPVVALEAADDAPGQPPSGGADAGIDSPGAPLTLGIGDSVSVQVFGRPELSIATSVADDGTIPMPLAGAVPIAGLSPDQAAERIAAAFRKGNLLVNPQVTVLRSQPVSVLGEVRNPGRFMVESKTTVLDVLAQAGGTTERGADVVVLLRPGADGSVTRHPIDLKGLSHESTPLPTLTVRGGDSIFVPPAAQFFIQGEVHAPDAYRLESGMRVVQAIARGGGITRSGSNKRIEITRRNPDGSYVTRDGKLNDTVHADDVIRIKERIF